MKTKDSGLSPEALYIRNMHRLGRIGIIGALFIFLGMPAFLGAWFKAFPGVLRILSSSAGLLAIFIPICFSEMIAYTPILGSSIYLSTVTGEILNLKLPVAVNAMRQAGVEQGTEAADIAATLSVCTASLVSLVVVTAGVVLLIPLQPVLTLPAVQTASANILPALFGALSLTVLGDNIGGGVRAPGRLKGAILPALLVAALALIDNLLVKNFDYMTQLQGFVIIAMLPVVYFSTKALYKKGRIKVLLPEDGGQAS
ncbi:MAG: hypothetical protein LBI91_04890 [Spirochaetaceae bacterium]|jgi:hypothetical protein|nr:hypothetical protein [Spirochaetaceae bacterium]